jgi:hypothetical protein
MNFYNLKSIVAAHKKSLPMRQSTESFCLAPKRGHPYIEPTFAKVEFETEKPAVILISAVGATGKSTLAQVLSNQTGLPLLDLGKHKPVGDNTLTGLLTSAFRVEDLSNVFEGIGKGTYGVIIDGVDEGRSKTTEKAFEAFLDDIVRLCASPGNTSFVLLGRTQVLEDCWVYLTVKGTSTGLITILPFGLDRAREYIDAFTGGLNSSYSAQYREARDAILSMLGAAFSDNPTAGDETFLAFIGYPPVLDAIVTLLNEEQNYHRVLGELQRPDSKDVEINLLNRIASYILRREKQEKVLPNIVEPLIADMPKENKEAIVQRVFEPEEQCARLVSHCLSRQLALGRIAEPLIDEKYEAQLLSWLPEHPFITGHGFRNAVFEAVALATLIASGDPRSVQLVLDYAGSHKYNYHLIYFLDLIAPYGNVPIGCVHVILGSALEFRSTTTSIELHVHGSDANDRPSTSAAAKIVETQIEVTMDAEGDKSKTFVFQSDLGDATSVRLGPRLSSTYVSLPCEVLLSGAQELEFTAPVEISAAKINLQSPALVLRHPPRILPGNHVLLDAASVVSTVSSIATNGVELIVAVSDRGALTYPLIQHVQEAEQLPPDPLLKEKYLRLKRILVHFRSHSRGSLAKYKRKIEHERVLRNETGRAILRQLLNDRVLILDGDFYFIQPENVDRHLGVSWLDLRKGRTSQKLLQYLRSIN